MPKQKYTFGEIKAHLQGQPSLHFRGLSKADVGTGLVKFSNHFFEYNKAYDTYQGTVLQTPKGKRRTVGDIYRIFYYYFPKIRLTSVYEILIGQISKGNALSAICQLTKTRVYRGINGAAKSPYEVPYFNGEAVDEFGVDINQFEDLKTCPKEVGSWGVGSTSKDLVFLKL
jgi:hypothetical protein